MKNGRLLALLASVALVAGCSSSSLTADTGAYIPPGGSVVLSASGGAAKIRVSRTEGLADDEGAGIRMYSQPVHAENAELAPPAHTAGQLPIGAFIAMKQVPPGHSVVIVNDGSATTRVAIHVEGADGFSMVQQPARTKR